MRYEESNAKDAVWLKSDKIVRFLVEKSIGSGVIAKLHVLWA